MQEVRENPWRGGLAVCIVRASAKKKMGINGKYTNK